MIALKQNLVPTDFSENSAVVAKYAGALAQAFQTDLHLMHVLEDPFASTFDPEFVMP